MFDTRSLRRKLGNLLPSDARQQLQNVLTVEWDTHKTVLVEVPGAAPGESRDMDMEMEGMGLNRNEREREGYGRLDEDWDDEHDILNPNLAIEPPRRQGSGSGSGHHPTYTNSSFDRPVPRPQPPRRPSSDKRLPAIPHNQFQVNEHDRNNPFASEDDFAPSSSSSSAFIQPKSSQAESGARPRGRTIEEGWNTFSNPYDSSGIGKGERKEVWGGVKGKEPNSPTSSRGTRDSAQTSSEENPFR